MKNLVIIVIMCLVGIAWPLGGPAMATDLMVSVEPDTVQIGTNFNGGTVSVAGRIAADATALIRVTAKTEHYNLKRKGRALGFLWMNLGSVEISNVPGLFLIYLPEGAGNGRAEDKIARNSLNLGMESVRERAEIHAPGENENELFNEFIKLKQAEGLYGTVEDRIRFEPAIDGMKPFKALLPLPAALPQGAFNVEVYVIENGVVTDTAVRKLEAREVGLPAWISAMAFQHGTLYGVLAVLAAVMAGLLTGVLFKGEKGAH